MVKVNVKSEMVLEDGSYPATVLSIEERETQYGERLMWSFEVSHDGATYGKEGWTSQSDSELGNLVKWSKGILGEVGSELDTDDLVGKPCTVVIETYTDKETGAERDKVKNVRAPKKGQKAKAAPADDEADFNEIPF